MPNAMLLLPSLEAQELLFIQSIFDQMNDAQAQQFAMTYQQRRKDPNVILALCIIGLLGIPGLQRFFLNQIGMGIVHLVTCGFCWIGTIVDLVNHKKLTLEFNAKVASEIVAMM